MGSGSINSGFFIGRPLNLFLELFIVHSLLFFPVGRFSDGVLTNFEFEPALFIVIRNVQSRERKRDGVIALEKRHIERVAISDLHNGRISSGSSRVCSLHRDVFVFPFKNLAGLATSLSNQSRELLF